MPCSVPRMSIALASGILVAGVCPVSGNAANQHCCFETRRSYSGESVSRGRPAPAW